MPEGQTQHNVSEPWKPTKEKIYSMFEEIVGKKVSEIQEQTHEAQKKAIERLVELNAKNGGRQEPYGLKAARMLRALAAGKCQPDKSLEFAKGMKDESIVKAMGEATGSAGGFALPEDFVEDLIPELQARAVLRSLGPQSLPMSTGNLSIPYLDTGVTAYYVEEGEDVTESNPTTGQLKLSIHKLMALVAIGNDLLRHSTAAQTRIDMWVRNNMIRALQLLEDSTFIRGLGSESAPTGLRGHVTSANSLDAANNAGTLGGSTLPEITNDLGRMFQTLEDLDVPMLSPGFIFAPRTKWTLATIRDDNGNLAFADEIRKGTLFGAPFRVTTQVPTNLDASGNGNNDESEVYLADFDSVIIGEDLNIEVDVFDGAAYTSSGSVVSGFSRDQTVMRAKAAHDLNCGYRGNEVCLLEQVRWAPQ